MAKESNIYVELWERKLPLIIEKLRKTDKDSTQQEIEMYEDEFGGDRDSYSFNLEIKNGTLFNNIGGSAVARDLHLVLKNSTAAKNILKKGHFKINMGVHFILKILKK